MRQQRYRTSASQRIGSTRAFDSAEWRVYLQGTDTRQDTYEERRAVPPRMPPVAIERGFRLEDRTLGVEFTAVRAFAAGDVSHTFVYGFVIPTYARIIVAYLCGIVKFEISNLCYAAGSVSVKVIAFIFASGFIIILFVNTV